jgi:hypothetical protein
MVVADNAGWVSDLRAKGFAVYKGDRHRVWAYLYPEQLLVETTIEGQARYLADWMFKTFTTVTSVAPPHPPASCECFTWPRAGGTRGSPREHRVQVHAARTRRLLRQTAPTYSRADGTTRGTAQPHRDATPGLGIRPASSAARCDGAVRVGLIYRCAGELPIA